VKSLEEVSFVGESPAVVKLVGIEISRSLDKISVNEGYSEQTLRQTERRAMQGAASNSVT
jgi:hypothetical protein